MIQDTSNQLPVDIILNEMGIHSRNITTYCEPSGYILWL